MASTLRRQIPSIVEWRDSIPANKPFLDDRVDPNVVLLKPFSDLAAVWYTYSGKLSCCGRAIMYFPFCVEAGDVEKENYTTLCGGSEGQPSKSLGTRYSEGLGSNARVSVVLVELLANAVCPEARGHASAVGKQQERAWKVWMFPHRNIGPRLKLDMDRISPNRTGTLELDLWT